MVLIKDNENIHCTSARYLRNNYNNTGNVFTYLGCSISYQFSNDVEFKIAKSLELIGTIKKTIFKKARTETILKT